MSGGIDLEQPLADSLDCALPLTIERRGAVLDRNPTSMDWSVKNNEMCDEKKHLVYLIQSTIRKVWSELFRSLTGYSYY